MARLWARPSRRPAEVEPSARVEVRARLRRLRELAARLCEREREVLARLLAGASLGDAGAGLGANPIKLAHNALTGRAATPGTSSPLRTPRSASRARGRPAWRAARTPRRPSGRLR